MSIALEAQAHFLTLVCAAWWCFFQLEEIRNIGSLPCLEKLNLSSNPVCIFPDYRTKVLAQFGDRAAEVHHQTSALSILPASLSLMLHPLQRRSAAGGVFDVAQKTNSIICIFFCISSSCCWLQLCDMLFFFTVCLRVVRFVSTARWLQRRSWTR